MRQALPVRVVSSLRRRVVVATAAVLTTAAFALGGTVVDADPAAAQTARDEVYDGTPDGIDGTVYRLYRAFFGREPDGDGVTYWISQARYRDYPAHAIANDFARSAEFQARYGPVSDGQFVDLVYRNVLGREPDAGGRAYWLGQMAAGMIRGSVMLNFSDSVEYGRAVGAGPFGTMDFRGPGRRGPDAAPGTYAYIQTGPDGRPLGYRKCHPVYVTFNENGLDPTLLPAFHGHLDHALEQMSVATGQHWVYVGTTTFRAFLDGYPELPGVVAVGFLDAGGATGIGGSMWGGQNPKTGMVEYYSGSVGMDTFQTEALLTRGYAGTVATTLMHEFAHVAGLAHVDDPAQVMVPIGNATADPRPWGTGDLAALARVGSIETTC